MDLIGTEPSESCLVAAATEFPGGPLAVELLASSEPSIDETATPR